PASGVRGGEGPSRRAPRAGRVPRPDRAWDGWAPSTDRSETPGAGWRLVRAGVPDAVHACTPRCPIARAVPSPVPTNERFPIALALPLRAHDRGRRLERL